MHGTINSEFGQRLTMKNNLPTANISIANMAGDGINSALVVSFSFCFG
jgi:hypothetical protein